MRVRGHARRVDGNRTWGWDGAVWATWRVALPSYPYLSADGKLALHARVRDALVALPPDAQLLGICRPLTTHELVTAVTDGVPRGAAPGWRDAVAADLADLAAVAPVERRLYLSALVVPPRARTVLDAAVGAVAAAFGASGPRPSAADARTVDRAVADLGTRLGRTLDVVPASPAELVWLQRRAALRGIAAPPPPREGAAHPTAGPADDAVLWEGGRPDDPDRPRHRRYLRVDTDQGTGYQAAVVVSEMPPAFTYPGGGEWFTVAELAAFEVDWVARVHAVANVEAQARARRQQRQLTAQFGEYDGEPAGAPRALATALEGVQDEQAALADRPGDPELRVAIAYLVHGRTPAEVDARTEGLRDLLEPWGYGLHRPTGGQLPLHLAAVPGSPAPAVCDDYVQHLLPRDLAAGAPVAGSAVGDPTGIPVGVNAHGGLPDAVLIDPAHGPATNRSGSLGVFGALGSGKSYLVKRLALGTVQRGGRVVTLDRTAAGEYARLSDVLGTRAAVVHLDADAAVGLDPLRVFSGEEAVRAALGFLTLLTRTTPTDVDGAVLAAAVRRVAADGGRLADVLGALDAAAEPEARGLRRKLAAHADHPLARLVLADRPPLSLDAAYVCFHAPGLSLPDRDAMVHEHLARQVLPEQLLAQALLYLVASVARALTFADPRTFGATLVDEAWALTASPQGRQLLLDAIRDGRKHNAAVWLLSQHPDDLGDDALSHLLGMRALFRQSRGAAPAALRFLGLDPTDDLVELVTADLRTGQCLLRDVADRVGVVQVLAAADPAVRAALDTTPAAAR